VCHDVGVTPAFYREEALKLVGDEATLQQAGGPA